MKSNLTSQSYLFYENEKEEEYKIDVSQLKDPNDIYWIPNNDQPEQSKEDVLRLIEFIEANQNWRVCLDKMHHFQAVKCDPFYEQTTEKDGHYQFKNDFERDNKRGILIYVNKQVLQAQEKVLKLLLHKIGRNLLSGKSVINISIPIVVFDTQTYLERFAQSMKFAPYYLEKAGQSTDVVEQLKQTITFFMTHLIMVIDLRKPFNPILGETLQVWINGMPVYLEQISHHPPIGAIQMYGNSFHLYGAQENCANMNPNSILCINTGNINVYYKKTNTTISYSGPNIVLEGTLVGKRTYNLENKLYVWNLENDLFAEIQFNPDKKGMLDFSKQKSPEDSFRGNIYKINQQFKESFIERKQQVFVKNERKFMGINEKKDVIESICTIDGIWHSNINFDGKEYWNRNTPLPFKLFSEKYPLPSDCAFRCDTIMWKTQDDKIAQEYKERLENIQRNDRKLRKDYMAKKQKDLKKLLKKNKTSK